MRFTFAESMCDPDHYVPLAKAAEEAGYSSFTVPDSVCYPKESDSKYPYTPDGNREFLDGKPLIEPFVLSALLAGATEKLRFTTFVVKLPIRHPVLVAKTVSSLARMSNNRFGFGVGVSPWPDDFRIMNAEWKGRGPRMNEMIEIIRGLESGEYFEFHGKYYDVEPIKISPVPTEPVPILVGGHAEPALKRAARLGDGWMHAGGDPAELQGYMKRLNELRREYGRENKPFEVHVISLDAYSVDGIKRLEDQGVTDAIVGFRDVYTAPDIPLQDKLDALRRYADDVIAKA